MPFFVSRCLLALALMLFCVTAVQADIYVYVDKKGVTHISNFRVDSRYKLMMRTPQYTKHTKPSKDHPAVIARTKMLAWGSKKSLKKPFRINETNRQRFTDDIARIAKKYRLDPHLMHAVISAESAFNPNAVSHKGAVGLMQLMPATAERFGVKNPYDPVANMRGGARYLRLLLDQFKNINLALAAYNAGEGAVARYGNTIPPFKETQNYVSRVLRFYNLYRSSS